MFGGTGYGMRDTRCGIRDAGFENTLKDWRGTTLVYLESRIPYHVSQKEERLLTAGRFPVFSQPMIAYLKGDFVYKSPAMVQVEANGIGYEVQISLNTYIKIQNLEKGILHTSLLIREDAHILYGFFDLAEKEMFQALISVSGIGASTARVMLSYMKPEELSRAITQG